jgi:hypothetical protein
MTASSLSGTQSPRPSSCVAPPRPTRSSNGHEIPSGSSGVLTSARRGASLRLGSERSRHRDRARLTFEPRDGRAAVGTSVPRQGPIASRRRRAGPRLGAPRRGAGAGRRPRGGRRPELLQDGLSLSAKLPDLLLEQAHALLRLQGRRAQRLGLCVDAAQLGAEALDLAFALGEPDAQEHCDEEQDGDDAGRNPWTADGPPGSQGPAVWRRAVSFPAEFHGPKV